MHCENVLEFDALRDLLGRYLRSPLGRAQLAQLTPVSDRELIQSGLDDLTESIEYLQAASHPQSAGRGSTARLRFEAGGDPALLLAHLRIEGVVLEALEVFELARLLDVASEVRSSLLAAGTKYPRLTRYASGIADLRNVAQDLRGKILPDGTLADDASVMLGRLRRDALRQRSNIEDSLHRFMTAHREDGTLQEDFVTIRNDRWVVPVITGRERRVDGVIHGSSGSGQTVFVEPLETIQLNNELVRLHEEELREVHRLLREYSARLREHAPEIRASVDVLSRLELLFAKAEFAIDFHCCVPRLSPENTPRLALKAARHPLLQDILRRSRKSVIPMSVELNTTQKTLLISGPNTGGKTVGLKTAGLLALMTHASLPVPADDAEFPVFDQVLADIGDNQSLAESLSSFSAHIAGVKRILDDATSDSLVLLDELGRATDPEEGGALGVTVLEAFRNRGAFTMASTHLMAMKVYGASTAGVLNGSMGFNEETLEPTYQLRLGAPGKSAGLDIASRLGLDPALIQEARGRMSTTQRDVAQFLSEVNQRLEALDKDQARVREREQAVVAREASLEQTAERKYVTKIADLERKAAELAAQFERRAHETLDELSQKARVKIAKTQREYKESVAELAPPVKRDTPPRLRLEVGARVRLKGIRQAATVRRILSDGLVEVDAGFMKLQVPESDVEEVLPQAGAAAKPSGIRMKDGPSFDGSYREINLIGQRAEEACSLVDKFLDTAAVAQVDRVRIVHGHGMGILKRAIAELLSQNPHVAKFYVAPPEEGGSGATMVELK